jgi:lipopolysaccharide transport system permease protein
MGNTVPPKGSLIQPSVFMAHRENAETNRMQIGSEKTAALPVIFYTPDSPLRRPGKMAVAMVADLLASRELAWRLFVRDISAMYRQSVLGYVWAFLPPIVTTLTFIYLNSQNIITIQDTSIPYPAFVMIGTLLWQCFLDALNSPIKAVTQSRGMLAKINFPREALILSGMGEVIFNFLVRAVLFVPIFIYYSIPVSSSLILAPFGIAGLMLLGLTCGLAITPLGLLYSDIGRSVSLVAGFWMLLTPVVYPPAKSGCGAWLAQWNPVSPALQTCRDWVTAQPVMHLGAFLVVTLGSLVLFLFGWLLYRLSMPILIERMGG